MNYLGHAFLSFDDDELLVGNMIGDHVKGKAALEAFSAGVRRGVELHRKIDDYADKHPATIRAKLLFREHYGLYAGAIMDTLYDHFLANDPKIFLSETTLLKFTERTYAQLEKHEQYFPSKFAGYFPNMKLYNWLYHYRSLKGMERSLGGLFRRAQYMPDVSKAYELFVTNYYHLNQCYYDFIDDMIKFVKKEIAG